MPADVTVFAASTLVYLEALAAVVALAFLLYRQPREKIVRWMVATAIMLFLSFLLAQIVAGRYNDPRPFATGHYQPLIAHAADNGFPSDHALLAAGIVAAVALASLVWAAPFAVLAALVEAGRVGAGIHHPIDVVASDMVVLLGALVAIVLAPRIATWVLPRVPSRVLEWVAAPEPVRSTDARDTG